LTGFDEEWERLQAYARLKPVNAAEVLRDYLKRLPKAYTPPKSGDTTSPS
jgi:hypothetical protein